MTPFPSILNFRLQPSPQSAPHLLRFLHELLRVGLDDLVRVLGEGVHLAAEGGARVRGALTEDEGGKGMSGERPAA